MNPDWTKLKIPLENANESKINQRVYGLLDINCSLRKSIYCRTLIHIQNKLSPPCVLCFISINEFELNCAKLRNSYSWLGLV